MITDAEWLAGLRLAQQVDHTCHQQPSIVVWLACCWILARLILHWEQRDVTVREDVLHGIVRQVRLCLDELEKERPRTTAH
jgi:hypothetical protein